ncbi:MAG: hypothetical protein GX442_20260 [Candidatus Riflebacteria bacterium]|nr:hypothetical protein [Candidatus Riflebacteria bacterium]
MEVELAAEEGYPELPDGVVTKIPVGPAGLVEPGHESRHGGVADVEGCLGLVEVGDPGAGTLPKRGHHHDEQGDGQAGHDDQRQDETVPS